MITIDFPVRLRYYSNEIFTAELKFRQTRRTAAKRRVARSRGSQFLFSNFYAVFFTTRAAGADESGLQNINEILPADLEAA